MSFTTTECIGKLRARPPPQTTEQMGHSPKGPAEQPNVHRRSLATQGFATVLVLITAQHCPGLPASASAGENKPQGRNPALRPGSAAWLLHSQTGGEVQLTLCGAHTLPNESRPRSYARVAPIPRQASTPPRANAGARQPLRTETRVGSFALMLAHQPAPAPGRRRKDCRRSPRSPACAYTRG